MKAAISRALSVTGRRRGGIPGFHAQVSRSRCARPCAAAIRRASVDLPEPELPKTTSRVMCGDFIPRFYSRRNEVPAIAIPGKSGHPGRGEIAMKNLILCSTLALCAWAASPQTLRDNREPISGEWKGMLVKGDTRTPTEIQFNGREPRVTFWGSETMPISPDDVSRAAAAASVAHGRAIHFDVPRAGTFDGVV